LTHENSVKTVKPEGYSVISAALLGYPLELEEIHENSKISAGLLEDPLEPAGTQ
jgi:hypothetical protein